METDRADHLFPGMDSAHIDEDFLESVSETFAAILLFWEGLVTDSAVIAMVAMISLLAVARLSERAKFISDFPCGRLQRLEQPGSVRVGIGKIIRGKVSLMIATVVFGSAGITLDWTAQMTTAVGRRSA